MNGKSVGVGIGLGLCFGVALGTAIDNVALGIALGVALGVAFATSFGASDAGLCRTKTISEKPLPHPLGLFERDEPIEADLVGPYSRQESVAGGPKQSNMPAVPHV